MTKILNTLAHELQPEQIEEIQKEFGQYQITDLRDHGGITKHQYHMIRQTPPVDEDDEIPYVFANLIAEYDVALLPAGSPALMWQLAQELADSDIIVGFAHTERITTEKKEHGRTVKTTTFQHRCWQWL